MTMEMEHKTLPFKISETKQIDSSEGKFGTIKGFASTFGNIDRDGDIIEKGAFDNSISEFKSQNRQIRMLVNHQSQDIPIGGFDPSQISQDKNGFFVEGKINLEVQKGREVFALAKQGVLDNFSIGFSIPEKGYEIKNIDGKRIRHINNIKLWEISVVNEPANTQAQITEVKSVVPFQNLPLASRDTTWDKDTAVSNIRKLTDSLEKPSTSYRKAFLWFDSDNPSNFTSYKFPYADVVEGRLQAVPRAINNSKARLKDSSLPETDKPRVLANIEKYQEKFGSKSFEDIDLKYIEQFLSDPYPLSRKERKCFISRIKSFSQRDVEEVDEEDINGERDAIEKINSTLIFNKLNEFLTNQKRYK